MKIWHLFLSTRARMNNLSSLGLRGYFFVQRKPPAALVVQESFSFA